MFCSECGAHFIGGASHGKIQAHRYYTHRKLVGETVNCKIKRIRADDLENDLVNHLESYLKREGFLDIIESNIAKNTKEILGDYLIERETLNKSVSNLDKEAELVFDLLKSIGTGSGSDIIREKISKISIEKAALNARLQEIENYIGNTPQAKEARGVISKNLLEFKTLWKKGTSVQKKLLIHKIFESLYISPLGMGVDFNKSKDSQSNIVSLANKRKLKEKASRTQNKNESGDTRDQIFIKVAGMSEVGGASTDKDGGPNRTRTCDLSHVKGTRYQLRHETFFYINN